MTGLPPLGLVVGGSLTRTIEVRLDPGQVARLGEYVTAKVEGGGTLVGMVTDVLLKSAEAGAVSWPPAEDGGSDLLRQVLLDTGVYTSVEVTPYLEVDVEGGQSARARSLPRHFARVAHADQATIDAAFSTAGRDSIFLGSPLGMDSVEVCVDIERLFERSAGIFGKSGTGKTVIALQVLDALVAQSAKAPTNPERTVALVFDMHNDYGRELKFQGEGRRRSLKQLHPAQVSVYGLESGPELDGVVRIGTADIHAEDLDVLQGSTDLTSNAIEAAYEFEARLGKNWIDQILETEPSASLVASLSPSGDETEDLTWSRVVTRMGVHPGSFDNLRRGLRRITRRDFVEKGSGQIGQVLTHIVQTLQGGKSVVIQFGRFGNDLASYMLVANMLSRRIWAAYRDAKDRVETSSGADPNRLVIVIEEAHKFIDRSFAGQSIFGQIARELRKYNVTLLVIDQRPSQIDAEVLSQIGTKFCLQLDSESDVDALIGGVAGRAGLRQIIASLESQQQALVFGHALPMPVVLRPPTLEAAAPPGGTLRQRLQAGASAGEAPAASLYGRRPGA